MGSPIVTGFKGLEASCGGDKLPGGASDIA